MNIKKLLAITLICFGLSAAAEDRFFSIQDDRVFGRMTQAEYDAFPIATDADLVEVSGQTQVVVIAPSPTVLFPVRTLWTQDGIE